MLPAVMMSLTLMMCATHIVPANIASLRQELPLHHFGFSRYIIGALHQHHFYLFTYFHSLCVKEIYAVFETTVKAIMGTVSVKVSFTQ